jgi:divinyl chlorophyllide a 8-vinyl-reductase
LQNVTDDSAMKVMVAGASGTIGQAVVETLLERDFEVVALLRPSSTFTLTNPRLLTLRVKDLRDTSWHQQVPSCNAVISCLASRTGVADDARAVDYDANVALLEWAEQQAVERFMLLSAICVQKPRLAFQFEKLRFEERLIASPVSHTVVRPTAFFKSLSGQLARVQQGKPFLMFGDGTLTACKPIADADLADFMVERLSDPESTDATLPIGGPGPAITPLDQVAMLEEILGRPVPTRSVSPRLFSVLGALMAPAAWVSPWGRNKAELLRIGQYYATESMLVWDEQRGEYAADKTREWGQQTLAAYYRAVLGGEVALPDLGTQKLF